MSKWANYETEELRDIFSDYHKDVQGSRPRPYDGVSYTRDELIERISLLDNFMTSMRSTEQGRAQLAEDGWVV